MATQMTLIDPLDQRLLFSADHPLGLAISLADLQDGDTQIEDAALVSALLVELEQERLATADESGIAASDEISAVVLNDDADAVLNDDADAVVNDDAEALNVIEVTTTEDTVDSSDQEISLREAISMANSDETIDEIYLRADDYVLTLSDGLGDLDIRTDGSFTIRGESEETTSITQTVGNRRIFEVHSGSIKFSELTISGGDGGTPSAGAGVLIDEAAVLTEFENITFTENTGSIRGGAIHAASDVRLNNVTISDNEADRGAGIYIAEGASVSITDSEISNNAAFDDGAGIYNLGQLEIQGTIIGKNRAEDVGAGFSRRDGVVQGGGIYNGISGSLTITDSSLFQNTSSGNGGGLSNHGIAALNEVIVGGNYAEASDSSSGGGGIFNSSTATLTMSFSTVAQNNSGDYAAGIDTIGGGSISDSLIVENFSSLTENGVGGIGVSGEASGSLTIRNSVVANNTAGTDVGVGESSDISNGDTQSIVSEGFNFIDDTINFQAGVTDIQNMDPGISITLLSSNAVELEVDFDSQTINSGSTFGTDELEGHLPNIGGYAEDTEIGMVFFAGDSGSIYRSDANFTYFQEVITQISIAVLDLEVDVEGRRVYWLDQTNNVIRSARFDGTVPLDVLLVPESTIDFELDTENQRIFTTQTDDSSSILQYFLSDDFDERFNEQVYSSAGQITALELDQDNDVLYWSELETSNGARIASIDTHPFRSDLQETIKVIAGQPPVTDPYAITIAGSTPQLFWTETAESNVWRSEVSGPAQTSSVTSTLNPQALTYDSLNERLLFTGQNEQFVSWTTTELDEPVFFGEAANLTTTPEFVTSMTFADIETFADGTVPAIRPRYEALPSFVVNEGGTLSLSNDELNVTDADTEDDTDIVFTVENISGGVMVVGGIEQAGGSAPITFTLAELKEEGIVQFKHSGNEPPEPAFLELSVSDGETDIVIGRIDITVNPVNDNAPVAPGYSYEGKHGQQIVINAPDEGLLSGVTDADRPESENSVTIESVNTTQSDGSPLRGVIEYDAQSGTFTYTPPTDTNVGEPLTEVFTYTVSDGVFEVESDVVTLEIAALMAPTINEELASTLTSESATEEVEYRLEIPQSLFLGNEDSDAESFVFAVRSADPDVDFPGWLEFDADRLLLSGRPADADTGLVALEVVVTDNNGLESAVSFTIDVQNINQSPSIDIITLLPVQENSEGVQAGTVQVSDPDRGDTLSVTVSDERFEVIDGTLKLKDEVSLDYEEDTSITLTVTVSDDASPGASASEEVVITVDPVNDNAPVAPGYRYEGKHGQQIIINAPDEGLLSGVTDADRPESENSVTIESVNTTQSDGSPLQGVIEYDAQSGTFTYTPPTDTNVGAPLTEVFTYTVSDGVFEVESDVVTLEIAALMAPTINAELAATLTSESATEEVEYRLEIPQSLFLGNEDSDAESFIFAVRSADPAVGFPSWLEFDADRLLLSGKPEDADTGTVALEVVVTDNNGLESGVSFTIDVQNINQSPSIDSITLLPVQENSEGAQAGTVQVSDPDRGDTLSVTVSDERFEVINGTLKLKDELSLDYEEETSITLTVTVSDDASADASEEIVITVDPVNDNALVAPGYRYEGKHGQQIIINAPDEGLLSGVTDADRPESENSVTIESVNTTQSDGSPLRGVLEYDAQIGTFTYTPPTDTNVGESLTEVFTYRVSDGVFEVESDVVTLEIAALMAPTINEEVASTLTSESATEEVEYRLEIPQLLFLGNEDSDAESFVYAVRSADPAVDFPSWLEFDADRLLLSGRPADADTGLVALEVVVTDNNGLQSGVSFTIDVQNINQSPSIGSITLLPVQENSEGAQAGTVQVSDPDRGDTLSVTVSDERFEVVDQTTLKLKEGVSLDYDEETSITLTVTVSDDASADASEEIVITVDPVNDNAPVAPGYRYEGKHGQQIVINAPEEGLLSGVTDADRPESQNSVTIESVSTTQSDGSPLRGVLEYDAQIGTFTYAPPTDTNVGESLTEVFTYRVSDGVFEVESDVVTLEIAALMAPTINAELASTLTSESATEELEYRLEIPQSLFLGNEDSNAESFVFAVSSADPDVDFPGWLQFDADRLLLSGKPGDADTGLVALEVVVTDNNGLESAVSFTIDVQNINQSPNIDSIILLPVQENSEGAQAGTVQVSDPDRGDTLSVTVSDERFEVVDETLKLKDEVSLDYEQESTIRLAIEVVDNIGANVSETIDVLVTDENDAPVVDNALGEQELNADSVLVLSTDTFTDQDDDVLSFSLTSADGQPIPDFLMYDPVTTELSLGSAPDETVTEQLILTADDGQGGSVQMVFFVTVEAEPELEAAISTIDTSSDIEFVEIDADVDADLQQTDDEDDSVLGNVFAESVQSLLPEDSAETVALLTAESINRLFGMSLFEESTDDENDFEARMLRSTVISDFLESRQAEESSQITSLLGIDVFDESVNLAALFGAATDQDTQMFASLSSDFERRSQEIENQLSAARIAMGSSFTVTTGLSVGYFLYLLRGGAIMSSMLTSLPAWRFVDPLPILGNLQDSLDADNESLQSLVSKKRSVAR